MRVSFLVDGFNVYHSAVALSRDLDGVRTKWLDLWATMSSFLPHIGRTATLESVHYFSAFAHHMEASRPGTVQRHRDYLRCLRASGVSVSMGRFKEKFIWCNACKAHVSHNEEKETDVAIAVKLFELFHTDSCDLAMIVSGDTDLAAAVRSANLVFADKRVGFVFPYKRKNAELAAMTDTKFRMKKDRYLKHQFPDPYIIDGVPVRRPPTW